MPAIRLLFALLLANSTYAAYSCCVDEDFAAVFLPHLSFSRDWPSDFPVDIEIEGFEFVGSGIYHGGGIKSVAWITAMAPDVSMDVGSQGGLRMGSSGENAYSSMIIVADGSAGSISSYFEPQMRRQGWTLDSDIQGSTTIGHVWRRSVEGLELVCLVTVVDTENGLRVRMDVEAL